MVNKIGNTINNIKLIEDNWLKMWFQGRKRKIRLTNKKGGRNLKFEIQ